MADYFGDPNLPDNGVPATGTNPILRGIANPIQTINAAVRPNSPSAQSFNGPSVAPPTAPTPAPVVSVSPPSQRGLYGNEGRTNGGPITAAASAAPQTDAGQTTSYLAPGAAPPVAAPTAGGMTGYGSDLGAIRGALEQYRAKDEQNFQTAQGARAANIAYANAYNNNQIARREADVAAFQAKNGADMVLGGPTTQYNAQRQAIIADAGARGVRATNAEAQLAKAEAGIGGPPRNYIDEYGKLQKGATEQQNANSATTVAGSRVIEANARATEAGAKAGVEKEQATSIKLSNDQHQKILALSDAMSKATTPADAAKFERQMLALAGKSPDEYAIHHAAGGTMPDPNNPLVQLKIPDRVFIYSKRNPNDVRELTGGGGAAGPGPGKQAQDALRADPSAANIAEFKRIYNRDPTAAELGKK